MKARGSTQILITSSIAAYDIFSFLFLQSFEGSSAAYVNGRAVRTYAAFALAAATASCVNFLSVASSSARLCFNNGIASFRPS
jgi:hypothetical protein